MTRTRATPSEDWISRGVIYQIFVRNFSSSGDFRAVQSRLDELAALGISVLWLMPINPIGRKMRKGVLGCPYAVQNYEEICSELGSADDFKQLVKVAHQRGMKVIVDWVANHTSWDSHLIEHRPHFFKRGRKKKVAVVRNDDEDGAISGLVLDEKEVTIDDVREKIRREREGLDKEEQEKVNESEEDYEEGIIPPIETWWDVAALDYGFSDSDDEVEDYAGLHAAQSLHGPVVDSKEVTIPVDQEKRPKKTEAQKALGDYMAGVMKSWVRDFDIDGFRCDVSEMVPTFFWRRVVREIKREVKPSILMLSEGTLPEHHVGAFDLTYAWNIYDALTAIVRRQQPATHLHDVLHTEAQDYPEGALRLRFITNHDKNFTDGSPIEHFGGVPATLATSALIFTMGGYGSIRSVPMLYNGDEVSNTLRLSLFDKTVIPWDELAASDVGRRFHSHYERLIALRSRKPALFVDGSMHRASTNHDDRVFAFVRTSNADGESGDDNKEEEALVVVNLSDQAVSNVEVMLPLAQSSALVFRTVADWYSEGEKATDLNVDHTGKLLVIPSLPAFGFRILGLGCCAKGHNA